MLKRILIGFSMLLVVEMVEAVTIPQGTLYFDNSKTKYSHVQFVFGDQQTYVYTMQQDSLYWSVTIPETVDNIYRYTFADTQLTDGRHDSTFTVVKEYISHTLNQNRTATTDAVITAGYVYVPSSGDNWAQGSWQSKEDTQPQESKVSGTLPILYVNTDGGKEITSKDEYITATYYIDGMGQFDNIGSAVTPLPTQIRGRGNWTWTGFDKKPYRLKLDKKQALLGMNKSKHWALMAAADDEMANLRNTTGYIVSRLLEIRWTPRQEPVELVLNGQYWGLYYLTETIRVANDRVNIVEQSDNCIVADSITGGWLVEIDNYSSTGNVVIQEGNGQTIMFTMHTPEVLSTQQRNYITQQLNQLNSAIYNNGTTKMAELMDLREAAKYYLVQEVLEDCESYHGSCYMYKDIDQAGVTSKWFFGPVWDFGNSFRRKQERYVYVNPTFQQFWIGQIATHTDFQDMLQQEWYSFYHDLQDSVLVEIDAYTQQISTAAKNDESRWKSHGNVCTYGDVAKAKSDFLNCLNWRIQWLYKQWGEGKPTEAISETMPTEQRSKKMMRDGCLYIIRDGQIYTVLGTKKTALME